MSVDPQRSRLASQRHVNTAIDYAPIEELLGEKNASKFQLRELTPVDGAYMHERAAKRIRSVQRRTFSFAVTIVHVDKPRTPLFSLVASKPEGKSQTLVVLDTHALLGEIDTDLAGRLVHLVLLSAQSYAYLAGAHTIKIRDTSDAVLQAMLVKAGYELHRRRGGLLYGTRKVLTALTPSSSH